MRAAAAFAAIALLGACAKSAPAAPEVLAGPVPVSSPFLRIVGLPDVVQRGTATPLSAEIVSTSTEKCPLEPSWSVDNSALASFGGGCERCTPAVKPFEFRPRYSGYVTVTATCGALTASQRVRMEEPAPAVSITDAIVDGEAYAGAQVELLEGTRAGETFPASTFQNINRTGLVFPLRVRLTARFFAPHDFELSGGTSRGMEQLTAFGYGSPDNSFLIPMTFVGDGNTDTYVCCNVPVYSEPSRTYPFTTKGSGLIEVSLYDFGGDTSPSGVIAELWCGGALVQRKSNEQYGPYAGTVISQQVAGPAACEVRAVRRIDNYRIAMTYPR